jgi:hypothetical protein
MELKTTGSAPYVLGVGIRKGIILLEGYGKDITSNQLNYSQNLVATNSLYAYYHIMLPHFYSPDNHDVRSVAWKDDGIGCLI